MHFDVKKVFRAESSAESFDFTAVFLYFFPKCLAISEKSSTFADETTQQPHYAPPYLHITSATFDANDCVVCELWAN